MLPWQPAGLSADKLWYPGLQRSHLLPIVLFLQIQSPGSWNKQFIKWNVLTAVFITVKFMYWSFSFSFDWCNIKHVYTCFDFLDPSWTIQFAVPEEIWVQTSFFTLYMYTIPNFLSKQWFDRHVQFIITVCNGSQITDITEKSYPSWKILQIIYILF